MPECKGHDRPAACKPRNLSVISFQRYSRRSIALYWYVPAIPTIVNQQQQNSLNTTNNSTENVVSE